MTVAALDEITSPSLERRMYGGVLVEAVGFRVYGNPKAQPRVKARFIPRLNRAGVYTPHTADEWRNAVARAAMPVLPSAPLTTPLMVELVFHMPRPKCLMRKCDPAGPIPCPVKPDGDNLEKLVLDVLTDLAPALAYPKPMPMYRDDAQVFRVVRDKVYHAKDDEPHLEVLIHEWIAPPPVAILVAKTATGAAKTPRAGVAPAEET